MPQLSDSQLVVLTAACQRPDRCAFPITAKLKGNAAGNVLKSLLNKGFIKEARAKRDDTVWRHDEERGRMTLVATNAAYAALGIDPGEDTVNPEGDGEDDSVEAEPDPRPKKPKTRKPKAPRTRDGSKQSQLIAMLRRAKGATVDEIVSTPFSSSRVAYPCRRLWGVAEPIPAAWAAAAKVRLSVPRPTGLVAARVGNSQRGLLWVVHNRRRLKSIGSGSGTSRSLLPLPIMRSSPLSPSMVPIPAWLRSRFGRDKCGMRGGDGFYQRGGWATKVVRAFIER